MSEVASTFVRRHVARHVNRTKDSVMSKVANVANDKGLTRDYTQQHAADDMQAALPTVKRAFQGLLRPPPGAPGPFLAKLGKGRYQILGLAEHDQWSCGNDECRGEAEEAQRTPGRLSDKKRRQAAARARAFRARRRAEQEAAQNGR